MSEWQGGGKAATWLNLERQVRNENDTEEHVNIPSLRGILILYELQTCVRYFPSPSWFGCDPDVVEKKSIELENSKKVKKKKIDYPKNALDIALTTHVATSNISHRTLFNPLSLIIFTLIQSRSKFPVLIER